MNDLRAQLPECPLEYEVPFIPATHTALVIPINAADINWQEKMLPWTLASLINNTDIVMEGVHLYIACEAGIQDRIKTAISNFDFPPDLDPLLKSETTDYDATCLFDINYWAFRDENNTHKLELGGTLKHGNLNAGIPYPDISRGYPPAPQLYDMQSCTPAQFRHAIKQLMAAQLAMKI